MGGIGRSRRGGGARGRVLQGGRADQRSHLSGNDLQRPAIGSRKVPEPRVAVMLQRERGGSGSKRRAPLAGDERMRLDQAQRGLKRR